MLGEDELHSELTDHRIPQSLDEEENAFTFRQEDISKSSFAVFQEFRERERLVDVVLTVGVEKRKIPVHRIILAATIPYFHAMFTNHVLESDLKEIEIKQEFDGESFASLIDFVYTGVIRIRGDNVQSILIIANFLALENVVDACCSFLESRLHVDNVLGIRVFAENNFCCQLVNQCNTFINRHFELVSRTEEFSNLPLDQVTSIISRDELNVAGEETVYEAVLRWVRTREEEREQALVKLLKFVRLPLLTPAFLMDVVSQEAMIKKSHSCRDLLDEAKDYHLMPERRELLTSFRTRTRSGFGSGIIYAVGGLTKCGESVSTVEVFNPDTGKWQMSEAMSMLRSRVGVTVMDLKLYAIGGYDGTERLSTVEVFDSELKKWTRVAPMNCKRSAVGAATLGDKLYVCGGYDGICSLNTVESYDAKLDRWKMEKTMSKSRSAAGVVSFEGFLIALGGHDGLSIFDSVERYNPTTKQWSSMPPMKTRRCRLGVATLNNKLYVCGGYDGQTFLQTVEMFDPETREWSFIASMNIMRSRVALVANGGKLYAIGGYDGVSNLSSVEVYDPEVDSWQFVASMCAHEGGVGVGVIPIF